MPTCSQPKCRIAETGICLEGHKANCPHLVNVSGVPAEKPASVQIEAKPFPSLRHFYTGDKLTAFEASQLLNRRPARVVLCAGSRDSGKTTFLARIGEMFRDGTFENYSFAGSQTLCGFERATWFATIDSGLSRPKTKRTRRIENDTFLHLTVCHHGNPSTKRDILISDLAGETFPTAVASGDFCADLKSLRRADHVVLFMDCARLIHPVERHPEVDNARAFLQRVAKLSDRSQFLHVQVVFSRFDYILNHGERTNCEAYCASIEDDFKERFEKQFESINFRRIASRPDVGRPTNAEIQSLFGYWLETPIFPEVPVPPRTRQPVRDFSAFGIV